MNRDKQLSMKNLQTLRNIGPATAEKLYSIGIKTPDQLKRSNPEKLFKTLKKKSNGKLDVCVLYQFRGAVFDIPWWKCKSLNKG